MPVEEAANFLVTTDCDAAKAFKTFQDKHGHRGYKEADLATKTWAMDHISLISTLQAIVRSGDFSEKKQPGLSIRDIDPEPSFLQKYVHLTRCTWVNNFSYTFTMKGISAERFHEGKKNV